VTKPRIVKHGSVYMNYREFSDTEIFDHSKKGLWLLFFFVCVNKWAIQMYFGDYVFLRQHASERAAQN
jgi:hypothetical protein